MATTAAHHHLQIWTKSVGFLFSPIEVQIFPLNLQHLPHQFHSLSCKTPFVQWDFFRMGCIIESTFWRESCVPDTCVLCHSAISKICRWHISLPPKKSFPCLFKHRTIGASTFLCHKLLFPGNATATGKFCVTRWQPYPHDVIWTCWSAHICVLSMFKFRVLFLISLVVQKCSLWICVKIELSTAVIGHG